MVSSPTEHPKLQKIPLNTTGCATDGKEEAAAWLSGVVCSQEIVLWRKGDVARKSMSQQAAIASQRFGDTCQPKEAADPES